MPRKVGIDRGVYLGDDGAATFIFLETNPSWKDLQQHENMRNKKSIDGYTSIFQSSMKEVFRRRTI